MRTTIVAVLVTGLALTGCGGGNASKAGSAGSGKPRRQFVDRVNNPWFPLIPGTRWVYRGEDTGRPSRDVVTATHRTRLIQGVRATAVSDRLYERGRLAERTTDYYAQDSSGNVWYFGEDTAELNRHGKVTSREGSWMSGAGGAHAGLFMPARPHIGQSALQEYLKGHAEDHFRVKSLSAHVKTPAASSSHALLTEEWTPLEPHVLDHKLYVRGIGDVREDSVRGGNEHQHLVSVRRPR